MPMSSKETEPVIKILQQRKAQDGFPREFSQIIPVVLKFFQKIDKEGTLIFLGQHYLDTEARKRHHKKRKLQAGISDEYRCKNHQQYTSKLSSIIY